MSLRPLERCGIMFTRKPVRPMSISLFPPFLVKGENVLNPNQVGPQGSGEDGPTQQKYNLKTTPAQRLFGGQEAKTKPFSSPTEAKADSHKIVSYATIASSTQRRLQKVMARQWPLVSNLIHVFV